MNLSVISDGTLLESLYSTARRLSYLNAGEGPQYNPQLISEARDILNNLKDECERRGLKTQLKDYLL